MALRKQRVLAITGLTLPFVFVLVWCLVLRPEAPSLVAPLFGPWAGVLYGHHECTLASQSLAGSLALAGLGVAVLSGVALLRVRPGYAALVCLSILWAMAWEATALLSVANTCI